MQTYGQRARRELLIGPGAGLLPFETGARFFAALAFPGPHEEEARLDAEGAWVASLLHHQNEIEATDAQFIEPRLNELVRLNPSWARRKLRTAGRRLRDRREAARLTRPWGRDLMSWEPHRTVDGIKRFTLRQIALHLCKQNEDAPHNFQKRIWRPSRPVLHYAIAIDQALCLLPAAMAETPIPLDAIEVFRKTIAHGNTLATKIEAHARFGIRANDQLLFRWID